ncbi:MAG: cell division protein ZapA [Legionella sp.]|jgi:cell division protein ZapA
MTTIKTCKIKVLNKAYEIKCPEAEEANLLLAVKKLNAQLLINKGKFKKNDNYQTLLLSALDIAHELIISNSKQEKQRNQVSQFISSLENKINHMVSGEIESIQKD